MIKMVMVMTLKKTTTAMSTLKKMKKETTMIKLRLRS